MAGRGTEHGRRPDGPQGPKLATVVDELADLLRQREVIDQIPSTSTGTNLAKYLVITKLKLENAIAIVRATRDERPP